ncbi:hypothetical protein P3X46_016703 [Hevea brasiliensis]|uniref:Uncharacterized protein n=1 Tax=Hevea brasiliensis TaxID=3981 RepID=A0ABQ9M164_HEVBR|nr:hypothetical protein P3X46_016703 [Hevea brasiliensis]
MKSLVCHTNGCTVFDSNGEIIYRVENYDIKCSNEVHLMDLRGRVLVTIKRKRLLVFGRWYVVAEVKKKQSSSGIALGDDLLTLIVEPHTDHSLIMAIVTVYGLINYKM